MKLFGWNYDGESAEISRNVQKIRVSAQDYANNWIDSSDPYSWIFTQLNKALPEGEIKQAIELANEERIAKERAGGHINDPIIIPEASRYAFRCLIRNSNFGLKDTEAAFAKLGIDNPDLESARNILPGTIWTTYAFPLPSETRKGKNVSIIAVYRNVPFVFSAKKDQADTTLISSSGGVRNSMSIITDKEAMNYPTLRDTYLGQTQIHFT